MPNADTNLLRPLQIGPVTTRSNLVLAPMSGVTDCAFRTTVLEAGGRDAVGLLVSEFVAAEGLSRDNGKTIAMLRYEERERPFSIQIFGADVDRMVRAAQMVEEVGADIVDINCGCPAPKVVKRGGGAGLMRTPDVLREILAAVRAAVSIPVTVKIRAGWDDTSRNAVEVARMVEGEGASMLAVHGRTRLQLYSGQADWDLIGEVKNALSIPVLGSGDITDARGALARLKGGYADGVMIGRGAIHNPWVFGQTLALSRGEEIPEPSLRERVELLGYFGRVLAETKDLRAYLGRYRGLACNLAKGMAGGAATRRVLGKATSAEDIERIVREFLLEGRRFDDHDDASHPDYGRRVVLAGDTDARSDGQDGDDISVDDGAASAADAVSARDAGTAMSAADAASARDAGAAMSAADAASARDAGAAMSAADAASACDAAASMSDVA